MSLLDISAILIKSICLCVFAKIRFKDTYKLMQILLDRSKIQQIYWFMKYPKASYLNIQFILLPKVNNAKDMQKTIVFVNTIAKIYPIIEVIIVWIRQLSYFESSKNRVKLYHSRMLDWNKDIIAKVFKVNKEENTKYIILVATDAYGMGIVNSDIWLVIQWDLLISFDLMIQYMGRIRKNSQQSTYILFTPK